MPQQVDASTLLQQHGVEEKASPLRKKSDRRRHSEDKSTARRRRDETEYGKRPVRQPRRRSTGNHPHFETTSDLVSPLPVTSRETKSQRPRSSRQGSSSQIQGDLMSPQSVKQEGGSSASARALAPSSKDSSPRRAKPRCTKTAEASMLPSTSIKMRERRSSLPSAASIRSPFKRSRERRPSLSNSTWMNTSPKIDADMAQLNAIADKDGLMNKIAPSRRMHRRRTIASGRIDTDSSSEEQPIVSSKPQLTLEKVSTNEGTSEKIRKTRRASVVGSCESAEKVVESSGKNLRSKSSRNSSSKSLGLAPLQSSKPSSRRSRSSSMQHVSLSQSEALKSLSDEAFRRAFVSVREKRASSTLGVTSNSKAKPSKTAGSTTSSASKEASSRKSKTSSKEKRLKPLSNDFDENDAASITLNDVEAGSDVDNGEGFFAVRSFLYEQ